MVYVAVVDSVGVWVYKIPADRVEDVWPGIGRTTISATVQKAPNAVPTAVNPCTGKDLYSSLGAPLVPVPSFITVYLWEFTASGMAPGGSVLVTGHMDVGTVPER
jgi:hypothetical protein